MRKIAYVGLIVLAMGAIGSAFAQQQWEGIPPPPEEPPPGVGLNPIALSDSFLLDTKQLADFQEKASHGDADAAFKLYLHHKTLNHSSQADFWLLLASARGQPSAQYTRWFYAKEESDCKSKVEALAWLKASALSGDEMAVKELKQYETAVQSCFEK